jgi:hypothetical protein
MLAVLRRADCSHPPHAGDEQARATGLSVDAKGKRGVFYETWSSLDPDWKRIHVPLGSCSRITPEFLARTEESRRDQISRRVPVRVFGHRRRRIFHRHRARARVRRLFDQRRKLPKRVEVRELNERTVVKLATERKHLTEIIKMVAYQAESDLLAQLRPHYARADQEGRTLLHELFAAAGDIRVFDSELNITLAPLSSPHRTLAAQALCEILDKTATIFPGSRLRVRFAMRPPRRIGLAFPGSPVERRDATGAAAEL